MHEQTPENPRILIVDDDDIYSELVSRALRRVAPDINVIAAEDGQIGIDVLTGDVQGQCRKPLLILLDINMPRMNGFEFLEQLRSQPELRNNVVFMFNTSEAEDDRQRAYDFGVAGYIAKSRLGPKMGNMTELLRSYASTVILPH
ncbi:MAG: response regulator [Pseudomonadota bacterium]|nr:response regulator [Pseudomonadota bacterium]